MRDSGVLGRVRRKREPWPGSPQAWSQPWWRRASSSEIASPSPVPPVVRARAGSARQKRLKTSEASPARRPTPWSSTTTLTASSFSPTCTVTGRPSPCSTALTTRLRRIRSMRRLSTSAMAVVPVRTTPTSDPRTRAIGSAEAMARSTTA